MRVLVLHNRYRQLGGEDRAVAAEIAMLRAHGVDVVYHEADNDGGLVQLAGSSAWSDMSFRMVAKLCREVRPDLAHVHNFWATLSPSVHAACYAEGVPTVQTLHNYRLFCANALFLRDGKVCTDCLGAGPWRGVVHRCYNHSAFASAAVARMISSNRHRKTWANVDAFIAPSEHARSMFVAGGIDPERLHVKPNFTTDPGLPPGRPSESRAIVYAGRLSQEKGVRTLVAAWAKAGLGDHGELTIIGDGPESEHLPHDIPGVRFLGRQDAAAVREAIGSARAVVVPSVCFETFGNTVVEGYASGRPVIASDIGALGDLVEHERTGLKFPAGDESALGDSLRRILTEPELADRLGSSARAEYLKRFTPERNFEMLNGIYGDVLRSQTQVRSTELLNELGSSVDVAEGSVSPREGRLTIGRRLTTCPTLGVNVAATNYAEVCGICRDWIDARDQRAHTIALLTVHSVMTAVFHKDLRQVLNQTDIACPDGMPLAWALRSHGVRRQPRVYGPDLMLALCEQAAKLGHRIFLYGGRDEVLETLQRNLRPRYPGLDIADAYSPPFRPLTPDEDRAVVERIRESGANIVFVGIGAPKQERWMASHREKLPGVVMLGVGAAFDFHAGRVRQAPRWMQRSGLEWFFRLLMEPRRLWKRYMLNPLFLAMWLLELVGIRLVTTP